MGPHMSFFKSAIDRDRIKEHNDIINSRLDEMKNENESLDLAIFQAEEELNAISSDLAVKWAYCTSDNISNEELNNYGYQGWELVNVVSYTTGWGLGGNEKMTVSMRYVFKRPLICSSDKSSQILENIKFWKSRKSELYDEALNIKNERL
jgi:hypothetical protein